MGPGPSRIVVRVAAALLGPALLLLGVLVIRGTEHDLRAQHAAPPCPAATPRAGLDEPRDCVSAETGRVTGKHRESDTSTWHDAQGNPHQSTTVTWVLDVETDTGRVLPQSVPRREYDRVDIGAPARVELWRGRVMTVEIDGGRHRYATWPELRRAGGWALAAAGAGLTVWALASLAALRPRRHGRRP
ncbi:hypothetical protein ACN20G_27840 (plasmid) [Streptomyces sp. BI20]|uniref:hypothetical protein n=1 Tax=Streptomyces sp. BI20 TaxID=3403460 RepID=UPI003C732EF4